MSFARQVLVIVAVCVLGCFYVWVQNRQIELSYRVREQEVRSARLQTEQRALTSRLASLNAPGRLLTRLESDSLSVRPEETRWLLRRPKEAPAAVRLARRSSDSLVRSLALWIRER